MSQAKCKMSHLEFLNRLHMLYLTSQNSKAYLCTLGYYVFDPSSPELYRHQALLHITLSEYFPHLDFGNFVESLEAALGRHKPDERFWKVDSYMYHLRLDFLNYAIEKEQKNDMLKNRL